MENTVIKLIKISFLYIRPTKRLIKEHMYLIETNLQAVGKDNILNSNKLK